MLLVRQVETEEEDTLVYECLDSGKRVGRLVARRRNAGTLEFGPIESSRRDVPRTLVAKLERDAIAQGIHTFYLTCRDEREVAIFEPAGYIAVEPNGLVLVKHLIS